MIAETVCPEEFITTVLPVVAVVDEVWYTYVFCDKLFDVTVGVNVLVGV